MKKGLISNLCIFLLLFLVSCNLNNTKVIKVAASEKPHGEILMAAKPILKKMGYTLKVKTISKYELGNLSVELGDMDANFFQHEPYFKLHNPNNKLVSLGKIHLEPISVYGSKIDSFEKLKDKDKIIISDNTSDYGRIVKILAEMDILTPIDHFNQLDDYDNILNAIKEKKVNFEFQVINADLLTTALKNKEGALVIINANYAISANLDVASALKTEDKEDNPYANILVVKNEDKNKEKIKALYDVLKSDEIKNFIIEKYKNNVVPV